MSFAYDLNGNLTLAQDADTQLSFQYDALNRLTRVDTAATAAQPASQSDYLYDANGNLTQLSATPIGRSGQFLTYTYDALNRLTRTSTGFSGFGQAPTFTYDALSRRTSMTLPSGAIANYTYDAASHLTSLVHSLNGTTIGSLNYTYDAVGNRTAMTEVAGTNTYNYDPLNRLTQAAHPQPANPAESFTYDPVGNRTSSHLAAGQLYDAANRLLQDSNFTYTYDENGNLTSKTSRANGEVTTYTYDAENQLIRVDRPGIVAEHRYDALGRRIEKVVNGVSTRYMYHNEDIVVELDGANNVTALYIHGPGIDEPLAMFRSVTGVQVVAFHADGLGSITTLTDLNGNPVRTYTYDSFGRLVAQTGTVTNPYTYTGRELDPESGLLYYRTRYYDPAAARFLQEDLLSLKNLRASRRSLPNEMNSRRLLRNPELQNLYAYVKNNPFIYADPYGLLSVDLGLGATLGPIDITYGFISGEFSASLTTPGFGGGGFLCFNFCEEAQQEERLVCPLFEDKPLEPLPFTYSVGPRRLGVSFTDDFCTFCINFGPAVGLPVNIGVPLF